MGDRAVELFGGKSRKRKGVNARQGKSKQAKEWGIAKKRGERLFS